MREIITDTNVPFSAWLAKHVPDGFVLRKKTFWNDADAWYLEIWSGWLITIVHNIAYANYDHTVTLLDPAYYSTIVNLINKYESEGHGEMTLFRKAK